MTFSHDLRHDSAITVKFSGMGIDKKDVRRVIHFGVRIQTDTRRLKREYESRALQRQSGGTSRGLISIRRCSTLLCLQAPKSLECYYQESGRAGRDGVRSRRAWPEAWSTGTAV